MTIPVTPARPSPRPAPVVECVYVGEVCPRLPVPFVGEAVAHQTIVMGVRLGWVVGSNTPAPSYRY